jgi:hypothetical protein
MNGRQQPTTKHVLTVTKNIILPRQRRRELIFSFRDLLQVRKQLYALHTFFEIKTMNVVVLV